MAPARRAASAHGHGRYTIERRLISPRFAVNTSGATRVRYRREEYQGRTHRLLLRCTIDVSIHLPDGYRSFYDAKRKSLWYLGWKVSLLACNYPLINSDNLSQGPKECEDPQLDVRATYYILQKSRYLQIYSKAQPSKKIAKFNMVKPEDRRAFVDVWRLIPDRYPSPQMSACLKRKDLLRIQGLRSGGHRRRNVKKKR